MLLQHYNYLAIKATQKPHYGMSWGLVRLGYMPCTHSYSSQTINFSFFHIPQASKASVLNYYMITKAFWQMFLKNHSDYLIWGSVEHIWTVNTILVIDNFFNNLHLKKNTLFLSRMATKRLIWAKLRLKSYQLWSHKIDRRLFKCCLIDRYTVIQ